jgi:hypothetical protein
VLEIHSGTEECGSRVVTLYDGPIEDYEGEGPRIEPPVDQSHSKITQPIAVEIAGQLIWVIVRYGRPRYSAATSFSRDILGAVAVAIRSDAQMRLLRQPSVQDSELRGAERVPILRLRASLNDDARRSKEKEGFHRLASA